MDTQQHLEAARKCLAAGLPWDAIYHLRAHLRGDPASWEGHFQLGRACLGVGQTDDAMLHWSLAEQLARPLAPVTKSMLSVAVEHKNWYDASRLFNDIMHPHKLEPALVDEVCSRVPKVLLNIGGGPNFCYPHWINVDEVTGPLNPVSLHLRADTVLPVDDASMRLVYSSHCLEHLEDATVERILSESRRVVARGGALLIKLPDFDRAQKAARLGDASFFADHLWNFPAATVTWPNRGIPDTPLYRGTFVMGNFWNTAYGHCFGESTPQSPGAYLGPAAVGEDTLRHAMEHWTPKCIADWLRRESLEKETDITFGHQNAWSKEEFINLVEDNGFFCASTENGKIIERYSYVPLIEHMQEISQYYIFFPKS